MVEMDLSKNERVFPFGFDAGMAHVPFANIHILRGM